MSEKQHFNIDPMESIKNAENGKFANIEVAKADPRFDVKIKYHCDYLTRAKVDPNGDFIDLRAWRIKVMPDPYYNNRSDMADLTDLWIDLRELITYDSEEYVDWSVKELKDLISTVGPKGNCVYSSLSKPNGDIDEYSNTIIKNPTHILVDLGVSIKLPDGYWGQLVPRSSLYANHGIIVTNSFGVIDSSYCGEDDHWMLSCLVFKPWSSARNGVKPIAFNERICQFRIVKKNDINLIEVDSMEDESRGGFGSTGKN